MEVSIICLSLACVLLSLTTAALAGSLPWLWWKHMQQEQRLKGLDRKVKQLDTSLADVLKMALGEPMNPTGSGNSSSSGMPANGRMTLPNR